MLDRGVDTVSLMNDMDAIYDQYVLGEVSRSTMLTMREITIVNSLTELKRQLEERYPKDLPVKPDPIPPEPTPVPAPVIVPPAAEPIIPSAPEPVVEASVPETVLPQPALVEAPIISSPVETSPAPVTPESPVPSAGPVDLSIPLVPPAVVEEPFTL